MLQNKYDLIIAGGGPAGVTTAVTYKKFMPDANILIFDTQKFPRHKIGESILPGTFEILRHLGLEKAFENRGFPRKMGAYYFWGKSHGEGFLLPSNKLSKKGKMFIDETPHIHSYHVERYKYDQFLVEEAQKKGIDFIDDVTVDTVSFTDDDTIKYISINGNKIDADFFIDATGIYSGIIPNSIKQIQSSSFSGDVCYHGYLEGAEYLHDFPGLDNRVATTVGSYGNNCWFWYIPVSADVVSVGMVFKASSNKDFLDVESKEELLMKIISSVDKVKNATKDAYFINYRGLEKISTVRNWNGFSQKMYGKNWMLVGDSAFFSDPILSAGTTMGHRTGYYAGTILYHFFSTENEKYRSLLLETYEKYGKDFYNQVQGIIKFWYDGMDSDLGIEELFSKGGYTLKQFGIVDNTSVNNAFLYIVNGFLQYVTGNIDVGTGGYGQEEYEELIYNVTGVNVSISGDEITSSDVFTNICGYKISKRLRLYALKIMTSYYIEIDNAYKSSFFIRDELKHALVLIDGKKTFGDICTQIDSLDAQGMENLRKDIERLICLGFLQKEI